MNKLISKVESGTVHIGNLVHVKRNAFLLLLLIISGSLFIRYSYISLRYVPVGDESQYISVVKNVHEGRGWVKDTEAPGDNDRYVPAHDISPLYVWSVSLLNRLAGYSTRNLYYTNLVFSLILSVLVFAVTQAMFGSSVISLIATAIVSVDPIITKMTWHATKDLSFCCCTFALVLTLLYLKRKWAFASLVVVTALLVLSRKNGYWFVPPVMVHLWFFDKDKTIGKRFYRQLLFFVPLFLLVLPWYIYLASLGKSEFSAVSSFVKGSFGSHGLIALLRNMKLQMELAINGIITDSPISTVLISFGLLAFVLGDTVPLSGFWLFSFVFFMTVLSTRTFEDTSLHFYLLPFFPASQIYMAYGLVAVVKRVTGKKAVRVAVVFLILFVAIVPLVEGIRNHIHPQLRRKYDELGRYDELQDVVEFINKQIKKGSKVSLSSDLRHFLYDIDPLVVPLPESSGAFNYEYFFHENVDIVVVGIRNLRMVEAPTARTFLGAWWYEQENRIHEKRIPPFLERVYQTESQLVYRVLSPKNTRPISLQTQADKGAYCNEL